MEFKVGDRVVLKDNSKFKDQQVGIGMIFYVNGLGWVNIEWENNTKAGYPISDLILVNHFIEKKINEYEVIKTDKEISIINKDKDCITLSLEDFNKISKEINKK